MEKKILGFGMFVEKKLDLTDLKGDQKRGAALVAKLKNKDDVELDSGSVVKIDKMKDPDIDGAWQDPSVAVANIVDADGEFDIVKATQYFKNMKSKSESPGKFRKNSYVPVLKDDSGAEHPLTDLKKSLSFGSSGAGVKIREHESIQMIFLAKRLSEGKDFSAPEMQAIRGKNRYAYPEMARMLNELKGKSSFEFGNIKAKTAPGFVLTDEMAKYYSADQSWLSTFCNVPNKLANQKDKKGWKVLTPGMGYTIFHVANKDANSIPNAIFDKFKQISKMRKTEAAEEKEEPHFSRLPLPAGSPRYERPFDRASKEEIEFSKYCPADIYVVETKAINGLLEGIKSCSDILELNVYLNDSFNDRQIIPISLKRVGPSPKSAMIIVNAEEGTELPTFDVASFRLSSEPDKGIASKIMTDSEWTHDGKVVTRQRNLTLDSPNTRKNSNIDAEIDGVWARHGKISLLWIKKFIEESDIYQAIHDRVDIAISEWKPLKSLNMDELQSLLEKISEDIEAMETEIGIDVTHDLSGKDIKDSENKMISKIQSLQVIRALSAIDKFDKEKKEVDRIVSKMLLYALSIQNPGFSSPKYVRVI